MYGVRILTRHANARGVAHGGLLTTVADLVLGYSAAFSRQPPVSLSTVNMSIDFVATASVGDWLEGRADLQRIGQTLAFANAYLSVGKRRIVRASSVLAVQPGPLSSQCQDGAAGATKA